MEKNRIIGANLDPSFMQLYKTQIKKKYGVLFNRRSNLTEADRAEIIENPNNETHVATAKKYGVTITTIRHIRQPEAREKHLLQQKKYYAKRKSKKQ